MPYGQFSQLKELNLLSNKLSTLPEAIGQLSQLRESEEINPFTVLFSRSWMVEW